MFQTLAGWEQQYGSIYKWELGLQTMLVVSDPMEIAKICSNINRHANLDKWHPFYSTIEIVSFGCMLFSLLISTINRAVCKIGKTEGRTELLVQRAPHYSLIGTPDYEQWKHYRKIMNPAFSPNNIRQASLSSFCACPACLVSCSGACNWQGYICA